MLSAASAFECYLPLLPAEAQPSGVAIAQDEPLFPRYLFIRLDQGPQAKSWAPIRSTIGVSRLVSFGSEPAPVAEGLVEAIRLREAHHRASPPPLFRAGENVTLTRGPFAGLDAVFQTVDSERRAMVLIEMMSRPVVLRVASAALRRVQ